MAFDAAFLCPEHLRCAVCDITRTVCAAQPSPRDTVQMHFYVLLVALAQRVTT
jgi:hypothetical protein